jgi:hypothetical protein
MGIYSERKTAQLYHTLAYEDNYSHSQNKTDDKGGTMSRSSNCHPEYSERYYFIVIPNLIGNLAFLSLKGRG